MLFKKIFLLNSKKFFCLNYFIDVNSLEIPEKNLFTATEIAFLVPLFNTDLCRSFFLSNDWIRVHYPKFKTNLNGCKKASKPLVKYIAELLLKGRIGDRLDNYFMSLYYKRSRKKFSNAGEEFFNINFKSDKNVAKYHPNGYQQIIMKRYEAKVAEYSFLHQLDLE